MTTATLFNQTCTPQTGRVAKPAPLPIRDCFNDAVNEHMDEIDNLLTRSATIP